MPKTTIVGLFDDEKSIHNIEKGLKKRGFGKGQMHALTSKDVSKGKDPWGIGKGGGDSTDKLMRELTSRGVPENDARDFAEAVRRGGNLLVTELDDDSQANEVVSFFDQEEAVDLEDRRRSWSTEGGQEVTGGEEASFQKAREDLKVGKREVETGRMRVRKRVEEKDVEEDVNLREEHIDVDRDRVDKPVTGGEDPFKEETMEFTEYSEEPVVQKETHIEEEVHVGKHGSEHTETVRDTVRETHIDIDELSAQLPEEHDYSHFESGFREHHADEFGTTGEPYSKYEPAYRFGHTIGASDRYKGRQYDELEPDIRSSYEQRYSDDTWESRREAARRGFEAARNRRRS